MQTDNIQRPSKGLHTDSSFYDQPKDTYRFALNTVNETELGDLNFVGNEESNEVCATLPEGYILIGKVYLNDNETALFSVSQDETTSEIGILNNLCQYTTYVNDVSSLEDKKLNFRIDSQIQGTYRLRRGCEKIVYFVDGHNKPRLYNFDKEDNFKTGGEWDANKFELIRSYNSIPLFEEVEVLNSGGVLEPGSYNISIQYLDEDLNPTEWITSSPIIYIYNDDTTEDFLDIRGSVNGEYDETDFSATDKAIKVKFADLDSTFLFYRLAFIEASSGNGEVSSVKFTENIPTTKNFFIYTGTNFSTAGTEEEVQAFQNIIDSAEHIEQIENRLILANTKGKQVNFCSLQQYASRIRTDMITKKVFTNTISEGNTKNPTVNFEAVGYMPGEIYSFGIIYIFKDGSLSPVYHIPGKSPNIDTNVVFAPGNNVYPMDNTNTSLTNTYIDNSSCENIDYWGVDSEGDTLTNQSVRHHRFPLRSTIGLDLVTEESTNSSTNTFYQVRLQADGTLVIPCTQEQVDAGECPDVVEALPFQVRVTYIVDVVTETLTVNINPANESNPFGLDELSNFHTSNNIVIVSIEETQDDGSKVDVTGGGVSPKGLNYTATVAEAQFTQEGKLYSTKVFGVQFSGVEFPDTGDTNGEEVVGYYIVRNERDENEKTILDSGILTPSVMNSKYTSHGLLAPEFTDSTKISKRVFGLIHPEHKFYDKKYNEVTSIIQEGAFDIISRKKSKSRYLDVEDGTSFDSDVHKGGGGKDSDGWSIKAITRDNITQFKKRYNFQKDESEIEEIFYLNALESRDIQNDESINNSDISVYNISADNRVGFIHLKNNYTNNMLNTLPYVYINRDIADSYSTYRTLPYYKTSVNPETTNTVSVFGGDTFISPMRYVSTSFWDNRIAERAGRTSVWNYIIGGILVVVGAVLSIFYGAGIPVLAAGIAIIGGGALFIASGIKRDALVKAYGEEYEKGLRETLLDDWVNHEYKDLPCQGYGRTTCNTPEDDEIEWVADCVTDLWFESQINTSIRNGFAVATPTFIDGPGKVESGNEDIEQAYEHFGIYKQRDVSLYPFTVLDKHIMSKLTVFTAAREDSRGYIGHPLGELYEINPDYTRLNSQKLYYHLGIEYDCCSKCQEEFPHRLHYSEQAFQEELTDNYKVFLPNNYKDIEGEKGVITNVYRFYNNLYIHTEEALWHLPQNYQERVTNDIVSFIGTGSYFETPPRLIVDDDKSSAGTRHKWGTTKTKHGILFPSQLEGKWYLFNGNDLRALSDYGNSNWFKENMNSIVANQYYESNGRPYPFLNNPSNPYGEGFISTYDTKKERLIISKKDFSINPILVNTSDYELCIQNGDTTIFYDYEQTIIDQEALGYIYIGIEDCKMKFSKVEYEEVEVEREVTTTFPNTADIHVFFDISGSFGQFGDVCLQSINSAVDDWVITFAADNPDWVGQVYKYEDPLERWVNYAQQIASTTYPGQNLGNKDIIVISFCNEAQPNYHDGVLDNPTSAPTTEYITDYNNFITLYGQYKSFFAISYPIVFGNGSGGCGASSGDLLPSRNFLLHSIAALEGDSLTLGEVNTLLPTINPGFTVGEWDTLKTALQGPNPYPTGLKNYGWVGKWDRAADASGNVIDSVTFQDDIAGLLEGQTTTEIITVTILVPTTTYMYIDGVPLEGDLIDKNNSWTMSYSLKSDAWVSWHSYIPNSYFYVSEKFYSWIYGDNNIWKHNKQGEYQTFYGAYYPHILEYVSLSNSLATRIWNYIRLLTEAKKFDINTNQYVDERLKTFNKAIVYNSRQCSGEMNLEVKDPSALTIDTNNINYLSDQVVNPNDNTFIIDRNERDWTLNDLRDIRIDYINSIWDSSIDSVQNEYYIDKILNTSTLDTNKDWTQLESFRDKYLVIRLIFDNFANIKLLTNYSVENEQQSFR